MDIEPALRAHRKALVIAAEQAVSEAGGRLPDKSQLNRLISICGDASCAEEITNYLRYQTSRKSQPWPPVFADSVIAKIQSPLGTLVGALSGASDDERDRAKVAAWRLYAVFLARAFTYQSCIQNGKRGHHDRARR